MNKYRVLRIIVAVLIVLTSAVVMPDEAQAATPQIVSITPSNDTVISDMWDGVVTITYNRNIAFGDSGAIMIYQRLFYEGAWQDFQYDGFNVTESSSRISISGDTLTIDFNAVHNEIGEGLEVFGGDTRNRFGNDYKYIYWMSIDAGAIVSAGDGDPAPAVGLTDYQVAVQATPPQVISRYPTGTNVNGAGLVLVMTFDEPALLYFPDAYSAIIYKYDESADSWDTAPHICCSMTEDAFENKVHLTPIEPLETDTLYGVMISGVANEYGNDNKVILDEYDAAFPGIDYPHAYMEDFRFGDVWYFRTAESFVSVALESTSPAVEATEVPVDSDLCMVFSHLVYANNDGGDYYVKIWDYDTEEMVTSINADDILPGGSGAATVTISSDLHDLSKNKRYYVTIDQNAFVSNTGSFYTGISDNSWNFYTTTTHRVRFYDHTGTRIGDAQIIDHGEDAVPPDAPERTGYVFKGWNGSYTDVTENRDLTAQYAQLFTLAYTAGDHGSIQGDTPQTVESGNNGATVTAIPDDHYHFLRWDDDVATAERRDMNVTSDISVTALFAIDQYTLTYTGGSGGSIQGATTQTVDYGGDGTTVTAVADTGYHFDRWSDGRMTASRIDTGVMANLDVTALFAINQYTLTYTADAHGSIQGDASQTVNHGGDGTQVTAVADAHYHFVQWSDGVTTADRQDTGVTGALDVTAQFAIDQHTLTYTAGSGGSIQGDTSQAVTYGGDGTTVTAVADTGYHFDRWSDGLGTASRTDTGITADLDVTALFAINQYTLTYTAGDHGSIQGISPQTVNHGADGSAVTAVPDTGYRFLQWSDGQGGATRTDTGVTADINVTAEFGINSHTVTFVDFDGTVLKKQQVKHGGAAAPPADPLRAGYRFTGWDKSYRHVTSALRVTAQYDAIQYKVVFRDYNGAEISAQYVLYGGAAAAPPDPVRTGYVFTRWSIGYTDITQNLIITAQYVRETFTVTFVDHDGTVLKVETVGYGQSAKAPEGLQREGHRFTGWDTAYDAVTADTVVTALYAQAPAEPEAPAQTPPPATVAETQQEDDGTVVITIEAGERSVENASVSGGKVTVNPDGSLAIVLDEDTEPGEVEITLYFSDGTSETQTITIPEEQNAMAPASEQEQDAKRGFPWIWLIIAVAGAGGAVLLVYVYRKKQ